MKNKQKSVIVTLAVIIFLVVVYLVHNRIQMAAVSIDEMKSCEIDRDCAPVGCFCWCSGGGFSYEDIVNKKYVDTWYFHQECEPPVMCLTEACPANRIACRDHICVVETAVSITTPTLTALSEAEYHIANEDENIRVGISADIYSLTDEITIKLVVIGEGLYFHGPCDMWFERKSGNEWQKVGKCTMPDYVEEPYPGGPGKEIELSLPTSRNSNFHYSYDLVVGTYRYAITYWTKQNGQHVVYTPEFTLVKNP